MINVTRRLGVAARRVSVVAPRAARLFAATLALVCVLLASFAPAFAQTQVDERVRQLERAAKLIAGEQLAEAEQQLNEVLRDAPEEATALNLLGAIRAKQRRFDEAEAFFTRAVRADTSLVGAHMNLAYLHLLKGAPEKSVASLREVLRVEPSNAEAAYRLAWLLLAQGRADECIAFVEKLKETQTLSPALLGVLGDAHLKKGARDAAVAAFKRATELAPGEPSHHFALGAAWLRHPADLQEAEQSFRQFLKLRPDDAGGQLHLGYVLLKSKQHAEARELLERSVRASSATPEAFYYLGLIAQSQNEDARAIELFGKAIQLAPSFGHVHVALGATYLKLKDYERARASLEAGVKLSPEDSKAHYNLAMLYARLKQPERAQEEMRIVERLKSEGKSQESDADAVAPPTPPR
ncbi:MAG TPA: tetratricopeptide repeat protein [Pyrinomonadaceae bacterium]|nr:tetratricopeptide repeat protein [Pyrinomonadaceae bacterium]